MYSVLPVTQLPTIENISTLLSVTTIENETQRTGKILMKVLSNYTPNNEFL